MIILNKYFSSMAKIINLSEIFNFDNKVLRCLPIDPIKSNTTRQVKDSCFSFVEPEPIKNPKMVAYSRRALQLLDIDSSILNIDINLLTEYFCGNKLFKGSQPAAHCYCGHQFGNFAGQLGDGAAMYLGEVVNKNNERWEMQLKGSGKTPYSRTADGRKVLRSSLREFLCSEMMHFLGIPTSRAGTIVTSDTLIERDIFYDGHPIMERASVVLRIAPTFIRFGSFEICKLFDQSTGRQGPSFENTEILQILLQYVIETFYPEIWKNRNESDLKSCYLAFFSEVVRRTAILVAKWQAVGFCHGVLNTDNMSIVGITIDYGPFGFMDRYDPNYICNTSDTSGRYSYSNQPSICKWNCIKLAEALKHIIPFDELKNIIQNIYDVSYKGEYYNQMFLKIGMTYSENNEDLIVDLLQTMYESGADYSNVFLALEKIIPYINNNYESYLHFIIKQTSTVEELKMAFKSTLSTEDRAFFWQMANNDKEKLISMGGQFILEEEEKEVLFDKLKTKSENDQIEENLILWKKWIEKYKNVLNLYWTANNCDYKNSLENMKINPRIILRNHLAELAIKDAENNNFTTAEKLLNFLEKPFSDIDANLSIKMNSKDQKIELCQKPPIWAQDLKVT